ncbi:uncharacterized protein K452DRAFT_287718 [Aplosporella prunicola CBS 121167]|uniref:Manganese/iron superoxide dismutase C-terminal domain-containing protein n=1 Tax=Aplosporella prunicola CBS 121167 TaxID=1176127 RepID=A0A6A6BC28_9PEZI|nr:uncharacterized protein K452DRAFT_287718 [Aplosporella prunicola CBS 121167]KAF2141759.1 hypothetical protein K452DRAFT_287718 [Aplosporella prunicola CBS 121167]
MAYNNHMFFRTLAPQTVPIPAELNDALLGSFSSIETLKADFLATANAMFGPGFVWLVYQRRAQQTGAGAFRILPTYLAGSPLSEAHWRQQPVDMNTQNAMSVGGLSGVDFAAQQHQQQHQQQGDAHGTAGGFGPHSLAGKEARRRAPGGADVHPVLCVNTWEHVWLQDYGIDGKADFLENWWDRINWNEVHALTPPDAMKGGRLTGGVFNAIGV